MSNVLRLDGCRPTPLASYLKSLGVLRLIAEQADPTARGFWRGERFELKTTLDRDALCRFFLADYAPTPIIAPWNGGSGFYPKDAKKGIDALAVAAASRFAPFREAIAVGMHVIGERGLGERPTDTAKAELIAAFRSCADDGALAWIDAAVALLIDRTAFPPLLGTGGNDGRLDFSNNFMQRLVELFDLASGAPKPGAAELLDSALFGKPSLGLADVAIGQFSPGSAGGPNGSAGYEGAPRVNSWDFVLALEGAVLIAGGVSRRLEGADAAFLSYPFTVRAAAAGFGTASLQEQIDSRGEIWMPLWERQTGLDEIRVLFREGRLSVGARPARDGLDAARAVTGLGADRRIAAFERYGFVKRQGLAYLAAPLGRRVVKPNPTAELIADLDRRHWLERFRRGAGPDAPAELRDAARAIEDALFELTAPRASGSEEPALVQALLIGLGRAARVLAARPRLWELGPPPLLRPAWVLKAYDGTPEFRIATALAWQQARVPLEPPEAAAPATDDRTEATMHARAILAMRAHLAPLDRERAIGWDAVAGGSLCVWGSGDLVSNLCAVAQRRVLEQSRLGLSDKPFNATIGVGGEDIADFFECPEGFDEHIADLFAGLVWIRQPDSKERAGLFAVWKSDRGPLPLAYAALKPLFTPDAALRRLRLGLAKNFTLPIPPALPGLLAADRIADALQVAMQRARSSGLPVPFVHAAPHSRPGDGRRLLAALMIPVRQSVVEDCIHRAYEEEAPDAA